MNKTILTRFTGGHGLIIAALVAGVAYFNVVANKSVAIACPGVSLTVVGHDYGVDICESVQEALAIAQKSVFYDPDFTPQLTVYTNQAAFAHEHEAFNPKYIGKADTDATISSVFSVRFPKESMRTIAHELVHAWQIRQVGDALMTKIDDKLEPLQHKLWVVEGYAEYVTRSWDNLLCPPLGEPTPIETLLAGNKYFEYWGQVIAALSAGTTPEMLHSQPATKPDLDAVREAARSYQQNQCQLLADTNQSKRSGDLA